MQVLPVIVFAVAVFCVSVIWQNQLAAPTATGQAEAIQSQVVSPQAGRIILINVSRFQLVKKGDIIATLRPYDLRNDLSAIQTELDLVRARVDPVAARQRTTADYEKLRLEVLLEKANIAAWRVQLELDRSELQRAEALFQEQLIPVDAIEQRRNAFEKLEAKINATTKAIVEAEPDIEKMGSWGRLDQTSEETTSALRAIAIQDERLKAVEKKLGPITLEALADGMVSDVFRRAGEYVRDGEPILTITLAKSECIVSYLRQPFPLEPTVGMDVEIRTRSLRRQLSMGKILNLGVQVEPMTNALAIQRPGVPPDMGLPFSVSFPPDLRLMPGEMVDLVLRPAAK